jgi:hypothetical protein
MEKSSPRICDISIIFKPLPKVNNRIRSIWPPCAGLEPASFSFDVTRWIDSLHRHLKVLFFKSHSSAIFLHSFFSAWDDRFGVPLFQEPNLIKTVAIRGHKIEPQKGSLHVNSSTVNSSTVNLSTVNLSTVNSSTGNSLTGNSSTGNSLTVNSSTVNSSTVN